mgnify:CR=1 FL=1
MDLTRPVHRGAIVLALGAVGVVLVGAAVGLQVLRLQARIARRAIGKPLGEDAHQSDRTYKKKNGDPVDLLLLGDSIAAGLGADKAKHTLGAQLAKRIARATGRSVRLHTAAQVGAETSMLRAQLAGLPPTDLPDVAVVDDEAYIRLVDRTKDLVKSGGEWISSVDLENEIMGHPDVVEAAVIGIAHPRWDERPLACVVKRPDSTLDREELLEWLAPKVAKWWLPDDVVFIDEVPKTSVGKFSKKTLREQFEDYTWPSDTPG